MKENESSTIFLLFNAAATGNSALLEQLLIAGINPDMADENGDSPLHLAVRGGHAHNAALLLTYGANFQRTCIHGHGALTPAHTNLRTLHAIRQHYRRVRRQPCLQAPSDQAERAVPLLQRDGIVKMAGFVTPEQLLLMRNDFDRFIAQLDASPPQKTQEFFDYDQEAYWHAGDRSYVSNNAFRYSHGLGALCCDSTLLGIINAYLGRRAYISRGMAMRYLPHHELTHGQFGWHHDMEEQRLKMMVLLTDVLSSDQTMSYIVGSHTLLHPYDMFLCNDCSLDYCRTHLERLAMVRTVGVAGDIFLFDSNGAHRGNRNELGSVRDAFFVEFTTERSDIWGCDMDAATILSHPLSDYNPFDWMLDAPKKWTLKKTRQAPTWVVNLPDVAAWADTNAERQN